MKTCDELSKLTKATATEQDVMDMILSPQCWATLFLPLIHKRTNEVGVIMCGHVDEGQYIVKQCNMFMLPKSYDDYMALPGKEYATIEALAYSWIVD